MSPIRHFDHVGITVRDLDTVTALTEQPRWPFSSVFLDKAVS